MGRLKNSEATIMCHPERKKYPSGMFLKSNPTIGRAPLFRGGIYEI